MRKKRITLGRCLLFLLFLILFAVAVGGIRDNRAPLGFVGCNILRAERILPYPLLYPLRWVADFWAHQEDSQLILSGIGRGGSVGDKTHELGVATALICAGADLTVRDADGNTPLLLLLKQPMNDDDKNYPPMFSAMLRSNADPNEIDRDGETPLHLAVRANRPGFVSKLIKYGADPRRTNTKGDTPLHLLLRTPISLDGDARIKRLAVIAQLLASPAGREAVAMRDRDGLPSLHLVGTITRTDTALLVLEELLKVDPDLNVTDAEGRTAEAFSRSQGMSSVAERLAAARADLTNKPRPQRVKSNTEKPLP